MTPEEAWAEAMKFESRPNPYPFFDELRKTPVAHVGNGLYVVTGYQELMDLAHDPRISSDTRRLKARAAGAEADQAVSAYGEHQSMIQSDPPEHDTMRRQAMRHFGPPFSPDLIPSMEPYIKQSFNKLLDGIKTGGKTRMDVVDEYAYPVPVAVICRIMGVPMEDEPKLHPWLFDFMAGIMDMGPDAHTEEGKLRKQKGQEGAAKTAEYFTNLIDGYLKEPNDTMLSKMVNDDSGPDGPMTPREALLNAMLLFIAGHDSTVNTISHSVLTVLRNPGTVELLRSNPSLLPGTVEEVLRMESAVQFFPSRSATADIEIAGVTIPKGSQVHLVYGAANRDPLKFPNPNTFDPARRNNEHFGWGSSVHTCFGGPLARLEVVNALEIFINRVENPRLVVDPPQYRQSNVFRGPQHMQVDFDSIK